MGKNNGAPGGAAAGSESKLSAQACSGSVSICAISSAGTRTDLRLSRPASSARCSASMTPRSARTSPISATSANPASAITHRNSSARCAIASASIGTGRPSSWGRGTSPRAAALSRLRQARFQVRRYLRRRSGEGRPGAGRIDSAVAGQGGRRDRAERRRACGRGGTGRQRQQVADALVAAGIKGILNFAPVMLKLPAHVSLVAVDLAVQLEQLAFHVHLAKHDAI